MIDDDDMRAAFFDEDDFAETVNIAPATGAPFDILAIYDANPVQRRLPGPDAAQVTGSGPQIRCNTADIPGVKSGKAIVTVRSRAYTAFRVAPDGHGNTIIELKVA